MLPLALKLILPDVASLPLKCAVFSSLGVSLPPVYNKGRGMPRPYDVFRYLLYNELSVFIRQGRAATGSADAAALRAKPCTSLTRCGRNLLLFLYAGVFKELSYFANFI